MKEPRKGTPMNMDQSDQSNKPLEIERQKTIRLLADIILQNVRRRYLETDFGIWGYKGPPRRK
ncbi:hypothetical protein [Sphingobacterium mizutaii]|uniref:hypothetical protein n=1 Tax=Sphingobacterium mizutaii TaxID=1010 RepID=UPI000B87B331|nr:hypothetical protein [Sphingobacterium mizutaii]MBV2227577.1 hypothetical protein [Sphingobacterium mizutaii]